MLRKITAIQAVLLTCYIVPAWTQSSKQSQIKTLLDHGAFYNTQGNRVEAECYVRLARQIDPTNPFLKVWFRKWPLDGQREIVLRLGILAGRLGMLASKGSQGTKPRRLVDRIAELITPVSAGKLLEASQSAKIVTEEIRSSYGEDDADYLVTLEILGDIYTLQENYTASIGTYTRVLEIRKRSRPLIERYLGIGTTSTPSNQIEYEAKRDLARIISKLADAYWVAGQDVAAASLRKDARAAQGDFVRLKDRELYDKMGPLREVSTGSPEHPLCMPIFEAQTK
jgi:tetratricopeptide (TPR) repeat protein